MDRRGGRLSRRQFVLGAGVAGLGLVGCGRLPWQAPPPAPLARVGTLGGSPTQDGPLLDTFRQGLVELGWVEGQNLRIDSRFTEGENALAPELARALVQLPVDVILTGGPEATRAAREATNTIAIVMIFPGDPVAGGLVASLARPGGNITGFSTYFAQLSAKRLEFLNATVPGLSRVAVLWQPGSVDPSGEVREIEAAARALGVEVLPLEVRAPEGLPGAFETATKGQANALLPLSGSVFFASQVRMAGLATEHQLPVIHVARGFVDAGGLMSYSSSLPVQFHRAAAYVDKILKGTKPADLPVEQPMTFEFVVNLKTAQALGITFPNEIMLQVTEVIE